MYTLWIGNKNYSTWSMRPWLLLKQAGIAFQEQIIQFDSFELNSQFKTEIFKYNPTGKVPVLRDGDLLIWDSLAICEYLVEQHPEKLLLPQDKALRARARCISAEMHSGFQNLRTLCPMNIEADLAHIGAQLWAKHVQLRADVARVEQIWAERPTQDGFLCGEFSLADAFYAPVVMRFDCFNLPVSASSQAYMQTILSLPAMQQWMNEAEQEHMFVAFDEPYRQCREEYLKL